ncbi:MAG: Crp/Fnr family transcriptional regulator [Bacteroidetes bacterium]|nr:Crp/Fnr family transcriptional regulator [Bacteroidota bacterium]
MNIEVLSQSPLFQGISQGELAHIMNQVHYQMRSYEAEDLIAHSNDPCDFLYVVLEGSVRGDMIDFSGKTIKIEDMTAPSPVASAFLFGQHRKLPVNIVANQKVTILMIPRASVIQMFQISPVFLENFLNMISTRAQFLSMKIKFLSFKTIREKIAQYLLNLAGKDKEMVTIPHSQQSLADLFGVTRPSLARTMGELDREGIIELQRREIRILDRKGLNLMLRGNQE